MNCLEEFIIELNCIKEELREGSEAENINKLVNYLFNGSGWSVIRSLYKNTIKVDIYIATAEAI
jgi:hypothetical protein